LSGRTTIAARLMVFASLFVTLAVVVTSVILWLIVAGVVREQIDQRLDTQIEAVRSTLSHAADGTLTLSASLDGPPFDRVGSGWYWQAASGGSVVGSRSLAGRTINAPPMPGRRGAPRGVFRDVLRDGPPSEEPPRRDAEDRAGQDLHIRSAGALINGRLVEITATAPQAALNDPARRALFWLAPAMAVLGLSLVVGTRLQVRYGLRPLTVLAADIAAVRAGQIARLPEAGAEELQPVAREINRLVDRNVEQLGETRLHFANLAHGLKTPVASLLLGLNATNDPDQALRRLVERIDRRIRHHLARARTAMSGAGLAAETRLQPRIAELVAILSRIHAARERKVSWTVPPDVAVACTSEDLDEIVGNIVDNAFKWARRTVSISVSVEARMVVIEVLDDGPGIADETLGRAFEPGIRMDETVAGDGFGLAIAKEMAELYGGGIALRHGPLGGLLVAITLQRAVRT
jgi:signal transduction histidine kinase